MTWSHEEAGWKAGLSSTRQVGRFGTCWCVQTLVIEEEWEKGRKEGWVRVLYRWARSAMSYPDSMNVARIGLTLG